MHEILQSQGIGRCVVYANRLSDAVLVLSKVKALVTLKYCCISTKHLNITPNNNEQNRTKNRTEQSRTNKNQ
jgi:hypothetical protein